MKNKAAVELGRRGGRAKARNMTPEERSASTSHAARSYWASMTPEERSAEMARRRAKGLKKRRDDDRHRAERRAIMNEIAELAE